MPVLAPREHSSSDLLPPDIAEEIDAHCDAIEENVKFVKATLRPKILYVGTDAAELDRGSAPPTRTLL